MSWLFLLIIFWKPLYNLIIGVIKKDTSYKSALIDWFDKLFFLVSP